MAITVQCDACHKKYNVGDGMAGKKVRCKHCGHVFPVPASADPDEPDLSGIEAEEGSADRPIIAPKVPRPPVVVDEGPAGATSAGKGGANGGATAGGRAIPKPPAIDGVIIEREQDEEEGDVTPPPSRPANPPFRFPASELLDTALPYALAVLCIGWLITRAIGGEDLHPRGIDRSWLAHVRWVTALLVYGVLVFPITLAGVHRTGTKLFFGMPSAHYWKVFTVFFLPFSLGAILSMVSPGNPINFIAGVAVGIPAALGAFFFLFRLNPRQVSSALIAVGAYYLTAVALAAGLLVGVNFTLFSIMNASQSAVTYPQSPLGPAFAWNVPPIDESPLQPKRKVVVAASEPTTEAGAATQPGPTDPATPLVGTPVESPLGAAEDTIFPTFGQPSFVLTVKSRGRTADELELWTSPGLVRTIAFQPQHPADTRSVYVLGPQGEVARLVDFPRLAVEIRSADGVVQRTAELEAGRYRNTEIIGFVANHQLGLLRETSGGLAVDLMDTQTGQVGRSLELQGIQRLAGNIAVSADGELVAVAQKGAAGPVLRLNYVGSASDREFAPEIPLNAIEPERPVALSGLCFSPDGRTLAILYEDKGNRLVRSWQVSDGKQVSEWISFGTAPERAPDYRGRALDWLPDGAAWLVYGRYVIDARHGRELGTFDLAELRGHRFLDRDTIAVLSSPDSGVMRMTTAKLNLQKLALLESPPPATRAASTSPTSKAAE